MAKVAAAFIGIALLFFSVVFAGLAAGILKTREMQKREDAGQWQEADDAEKRRKRKHQKYF